MKIQRTAWFERTFPHGLEPSSLPTLIERLRGTPARLEERIAELPTVSLTQRFDDTWSIQENVGHLSDLEPLWLGRIQDLAAGRAELRPADLQNRVTHEAEHNDQPMPELLARFRQQRQQLVGRLLGLDEKAALRSARHPRLQQPMNALDLALFAAEHDDHHLARITEIEALVRR